MSTTGTLLLIFGIGAVLLVLVALVSRPQQQTSIFGDAFEIAKGVGWL